MRLQLVLTRSMHEQIIQESRQGAPEEICGVIRGRDEVAKELVPAVNVASERTINYQVDPEVLMMQFRFEEVGDTMTGIYHSHPESEAYPSATDAWSAHYPDTHYVICSLAQPEAEIRSFLFRDIYPQCSLEDLKDQTDFYETRPGLFACYFARTTDAPQALQAEGMEGELPLYVVYFQSHPDDEPEVRFVLVEEAEVVIVDGN